jgi:hypothetical protein
MQGCAASSVPPEDAAEHFQRALTDADWSTACTLLAPRTRAELEKSAGKPCTAALEDEDLSDAGAVRDSRGFGTMAQVRFDRDTVFLADFASGWKVVAAGCAPVPAKPYDCALQGG